MIYAYVKKITFSNMLYEDKYQYLQFLPETQILVNLIKIFSNDYQDFCTNC